MGGGGAGMRDLFWLDNSCGTCRILGDVANGGAGGDDAFGGSPRFFALDHACLMLERGVLGFAGHYGDIGASGIVFAVCIVLRDRLGHERDDLLVSGNGLVLSLSSSPSQAPPLYGLTV